MQHSTPRAFRAVLWDFGGVFTTSPLAAFREFERERGLPEHFIGKINTTDPDKNAWARFERNEIDMDGFDAAFAEEAKAFGHDVRGREVLPLLRGRLRESMAKALATCRKAGLLCGCITNNMGPMPGAQDGRKGLLGMEAHFNVILESSKTGIRKPDPEIYRMACAALEITPQEAVYLDDLGVNLKPARALGMHTIKVGEDETPALAELEKVLGLTF